MSFSLGLEAISNLPKLQTHNYKHLADITAELMSAFDKATMLSAIYRSISKYGKTQQLVELVSSSVESMNVELSIEGILSGIAAILRWIGAKLTHLWNWFVGLFSKAKRDKEYTEHQYKAHVELVKAMNSSDQDRIARAVAVVNKLYSGALIDEILDSLSSGNVATEAISAYDNLYHFKCKPALLESTAMHVFKYSQQFKNITINLTSINPLNISEEMLSKVTSGIELMDLMDFTPEPDFNQYEPKELLSISENCALFIKKLEAEFKEHGMPVKLLRNKFITVRKMFESSTVETVNNLLQVYKLYFSLTNRLYGLYGKIYSIFITNQQTVGILLEEYSKYQHK